MERFERVFDMPKFLVYFTLSYIINVVVGLVENDFNALQALGVSVLVGALALVIDRIKKRR